MLILVSCRPSAASSSKNCNQHAALTSIYKQYVKGTDVIQFLNDIKFAKIKEYNII